MESTELLLLTEFIERINDGADIKELTERYNEMLRNYGSRESLRLKDSILTLVRELDELRARVKASVADSEDKLSDLEKQELSKVRGLMDNNLFTYHFQPIVRADTGEIFSYEALMRSGDIKGITPFHILKYAAFMDRLGEIEQYTFTNMLRFISENKGLFAGRPVFINSMPSVRIRPETEREIEQKLEELSDIVVVEMTEQSEYTDTELNKMKEKYSRLGVRIAIDDYGTGYSNISNLLRYTPNFVKIDRSLLSGIQDNPNKKHFVREIIDFCHSNNIMALAEGVENEQEMHTVIMLGVDLIQGFYIARPDAEVIASVPYEVRSQIRMYNDEREHGRSLKVYSAARGEMVSLEKLTKSGYTCILVGSGYSDGGVSIEGTPYLDTNIHIEVAEGFSGSLKIHHAHLSNDVHNPCINISDKCECTLIIAGDNRLDNSGIRVHEGASLRVAGNGLLEIFLGNADYYGIGNDINSRHGRLIFAHDALIRVKSTSHSGVCIGSGLGGPIQIHSGEYELEAHGADGTCLGTLDGDCELEIDNCDFEARAAGACNSAIGSLNGNAKIRITRSSIRVYGYSRSLAAVGAVNGISDVNFENASITVHANGTSVTCCGSLFNDSSVKIESCTVRIFSDGINALSIGGIEGRSRFTVINADVGMELTSQLGVCTFAKDEDIALNGGSVSVTYEGTRYEGVLNKAPEKQTAE